MPGQLRRWHNLIQAVTDQCPEDDNQAKKSGHDESLCFASARSRGGSRRLQTGRKLTQAGFSTIEIKTHIIHGAVEVFQFRSEERRVGKGCDERGVADE